GIRDYKVTGFRRVLFRSRALEEPRDGDLGRRGVVVLRDLRDHAARLGELAGVEREPRDESDATLRAVLEDVLGLAVAEVVEVLRSEERRVGKECRCRGWR